jgi:hypothetical protein
MKKEEQIWYDDKRKKSYVNDEKDSEIREGSS